MFQYFTSTLQAHPELAVFLTLGIGYLIGAWKFGHFCLGAVTGTLLVGVALSL